VEDDDICQGGSMLPQTTSNAMAYTIAYSD